MNNFYPEKGIKPDSGLRQCKCCGQFLMKLNLVWRVEGFSNILRCHDCDVCWGFHDFGSTDITDRIDIDAENAKQRQIDRYHDDLRRIAKRHLN